MLVMWLAWVPIYLSRLLAQSLHRWCLVLLSTTSPEVLGFFEIGTSIAAACHCITGNIDQYNRYLFC